MKRTILLLACLILVISLFGCGYAENNLPPVDPGAQETTALVPSETTTTADKPTVSETTEPAVIPETTITEVGEEETSASAETTCQHTYRSKVTKEPTCSASGEKRYTCTICNASYREVINSLDHAYVTTTKAPDCVNTGSTTHRCKACGTTYTDSFQPAQGHNYGPWIIVREPTQLETGLARCTCIRCGQEDSMVIPRLAPDAP